VRLDTFSGAPVDLAAYAVDPAEVIVAGSSSKPRSLDVSHRAAAARWQFVPPAGYRFAASEVELPLSGREGFYVVEARRGDAVEQVWVNLSRIGLVTRESAGNLVLYACDLGTGKALRGMRVGYLAGTKLAYDRTDGGGVSVWRGRERPRFALAEWGRSVAFVSLLPQSPIPATIVGVWAERTVLHAGEHARVVGFVRRYERSAYRSASGPVRLSFTQGGRTIAQAAAHADASGAFSGEVAIPADAPTGDVAVIASAGSGSAGASLHVDAAGDTELSIVPGCGSVCAPESPVPFVVRAQRAGAPAANLRVRVRVVRVPHILPPGEPDEALRWGSTTVVDRSVTTGADGAAALSIPAPSDGLASTYALVASTASATAAARVLTPSSRVALAVAPDRVRLDVGQSAGFTIRGFDALDGTAANGLAVTVRLTHGPTTMQRDVRLDGTGRGHVSFTDPPLGTDLAIVEATIDGKRASDAAAVTVEPSAMQSGSRARAGDFAIELDRPRYRPGERITADAVLPGAAGDAFVSLDGASSYERRTVAVRDGHAAAVLPLGTTLGDDRVNMVLVRDGAVYAANTPLTIDGPGHPRRTSLTVNRAVFAPGDTAHVTLHDGDTHGGATLAWRLSDGRPGRGAAFDDAPDILAASATAQQSPATGGDPAWHAFVTPARSTAGDVLGFDRPRTIASPDAALALAAPRTLLWEIRRGDRADFDVHVPSASGRYVLSMLKMTDDGDVGAASITIVVE